MERKEESFLNHYDKVKEIARGLRGVIRSVRAKDNGQLLCAKTIRKTQKGKSVEHEIRAEIDSLEKLAEVDGVVNLKAVYETHRETTLILDLHQRDMHHLIDFDEKYDARKLMADLVKIVKEVHLKGIIHLDLKPQNVLLSEENELKLCDFGLAQQNDDENKENLLLGGTLEYCAPEQIQFEQVSVKTDVWSLGVIAFVLTTKESPFKRDQNHDTQNAILEGDFDLDLVPVEAKKFITSCLRRQPADRPTCLELLESDWLLNRRKNSKKRTSTSSDITPLVSPRDETDIDNPVKKSRIIEETEL